MSDIDRKQEILKAAQQSISLFGYKATTMDQVAKLARVGKGTIYTFFSSKEELFQEIMVKLNTEMLELAQQAYRPELSFRDNMRAILQGVLAYRSNHPLISQLVHEVRDMGTPEAMEGIRQTEEAIIQYVTTKVEEYTARGELKPSNPEMTAFMLVKMYLLLIREWDHKPGRHSLTHEQILDLMELYFLNGVSQQEPF